MRISVETEIRIIDGRVKNVWCARGSELHIYEPTSYFLARSFTVESAENIVDFSWHGTRTENDTGMRTERGMDTENGTGWLHINSIF